MTKTKTIETVEEYDETGKLVRKTTTETETTDDNPVNYTTTTFPVQPTWYFEPFRYSVTAGTSSEKG